MINAIGNWQKFIHEMNAGRSLSEAHQQARAEGFRGKQKDGGFKGFCAREGIPLRRAYRLMNRYHAVLGIVLGGELLSEEEPPNTDICDDNTVANDVRDRVAVTNKAQP
jgi:hypothetical protein